MVAHTGFEPVISALRGRRPKPLDECAIHTNIPLLPQISMLSQTFIYARMVDAVQHYLLW